MPLNKSTIESGIQAGLVEAARFFVQKMVQKIDQVGAPSAIKDAIGVEPPQQQGDIAFIDIIIDLKQAPMAAAYEWGSGEHATRGEAGEYPIPREGGGAYVAFPRERWPGYRPPPEREFFVFPFIMHPGVAPKPYIGPTIAENRKEIAKIIGERFIAEIKVGGRKVVIQ